MAITKMMLRMPKAFEGTKVASLPKVTTTPATMSILTACLEGCVTYSEGTSKTTKSADELDLCGRLTNFHLSDSGFLGSVHKLSTAHPTKTSSIHAECEL